MSDDLDPALYARASEPTLSLIVDESDKRIAAQVQLMLASDARTTGILSAAAALAAAAIAVAAAEAQQHLGSPLFVGAIAFSLVAAASAGSAAWALWPEKVDIQGWSPRLFESDVRQSAPHSQILADIAALNQSKLDQNALCNERISKRVRLSILLLVLAPVLTAATVIAAATI